MLDKLINGLRLAPEEEDDIYDDGPYEEDQRDRASVLPYEGRKKSSEVAKVSKSTASAIGNSNIIIVKPKKLDDAKDIIDKLIAGNTVAVDLEHTADEEKQRIMDMLAGYCYCTQSNIESINSGIYIISHTDIELEEK